MRRLILVIVLLVLLVAVLGPIILGFGAQAAPPPKADDVSALMQKKLAHAQKLLEGIALADFEKIGEQTRDLQGVAQQAQFMVLKTPQYELYANDFKRALDDIQKGVKAKNIDAATLGYVELTVSCVRCHKHVREVRITKSDRAPDVQLVAQK